MLDGETVAGGWRLDQVPPTPAVTGDLLYSSQGSGALYGGTAIVAWRGSAAPTYGQCAALLNMAPGRHVLDVQAGDTACVRTAEQRVGYVRVTSKPDARHIDVTVTVWQYE